MCLVLETERPTVRRVVLIPRTYVACIQNSDATSVISGILTSCMALGVCINLSKNGETRSVIRL